MRSRFLNLYVLLTLWGLGIAAVQGQTPMGGATVEMSGVKPEMKYEARVEGFLKPLNGKVKLRASEVQFEPGAKLGNHLHVGPGIRLVLAGELTVIDGETNKEQTVRAGEYFYEAGNRSFLAQNRTAQPAKLLVVEMLPAEWRGTAMAPISRYAELEKEGARMEALFCQSK